MESDFQRLCRETLDFYWRFSPVSATFMGGSRFRFGARQHESGFHPAGHCRLQGAPG